MKLREKTEIQKLEEEIRQVSYVINDLIQERNEKYKIVQDFTVSENRAKPIIEKLGQITSKIKSNTKKLSKLEGELKKLRNAG